MNKMLLLKDRYELVLLGGECVLLLFPKEGGQANVLLGARHKLMNPIVKYATYCSKII